MNELDRVADYLKEHDDYLIVSHVSPDGDTLGCGLCMLEALESMGKKAVCCCEDEVPQRYAFLPRAGEMKKPEDAGDHETVFCVDCADLKRCGSAMEKVEQAEYSVCVDHHPSNPGFSKLFCLLPYPSCGEIIVELLKKLDVRLTKTMGECLYTAIASDTGNFSYAGVDRNTFLTMADVMESGISVWDLNQKIFRSEPLRKVKIRSYVIGKMEILVGGKVTLSWVDQEELQSFGCTSADLEGIVDSLRDIESVEATAFLYEGRDHVVRCSFRGKGNVDVCKVAQKHDGGGHKAAAGCSLYMPIREAVDLIRQELSDEIQWTKII